MIWLRCAGRAAGLARALSRMLFSSALASAPAAGLALEEEAGVRRAGRGGGGAARLGHG